MAQRAETTVAENSLRSCVLARFHTMLTQHIQSFQRDIVCSMACACLGVFYHLRVRQNDRDILRVTAGGDVAQLVERRTGTLPTQVRFPGVARDFFFPE